MSCYPEINLLQPEVATQDFAKYFPSSSNLGGKFQLESLVDGERKITLHSLADGDLEQFASLFDRIIEETDWALTLDWDGLDEEFGFPYKSLSRPAGADEPVLLWPDD